MWRLETGSTVYPKPTPKPWVGSCYSSSTSSWPSSSCEPSERAANMDRAAEANPTLKRAWRVLKKENEHLRADLSREREKVAEAQAQFDADMDAEREEFDRAVADLRAGYERERERAEAAEIERDQLRASGRQCDREWADRKKIELAELRERAEKAEKERDALREHCRIRHKCAMGEGEDPDYGF